MRAHHPSPRWRPLTRAIRQAGKKRFLPILLTSLTTFVGLAPLLLEKSVQAQPPTHALSLGATLVTHNTRHFQRIEGLRLEDWNEEPSTSA